jgi:hypothetical protein
MKTLEHLKKKELIKLITEVRPKADAYDRVCEKLGIENNILTFVKNLDIQCVINRRELLVAFNKEMAELHIWFLPAEDSMIDEFLSNQ